MDAVRAEQQQPRRLSRHRQGGSSDDLRLLGKDGGVSSRRAMIEHKASSYGGGGDGRTAEKLSGGGGGLNVLRRRKTRSRSAPASLRRRRPLIEDHYRVDPKARMVLPGVPKQDDDNLARDIHDFFNLIVLVPVVVLNAMNWDVDSLWADFDGVENAWTGKFFELFFTVTALYFAVDLLWVACIPRCVKSPGTIVQHHVATLLYILIPRYYPEYRWLMGACMSVEVNTWFLIARRVFNKQGLPPWIIDLPPFLSIRVKLISVCFYVSWVGIRCFLYPLIWDEIRALYLDLSEELESHINILLVAMVLHSVFCALNLKWSYDLLMSKIRYWRKGGEYKVDKGL